MFIIITSLLAPFCFFSLRERLKKRRAKKKKEIEDLIEKYVVEEKKSLMRQKLAKVFELIAKTEEYIERIVRKKVKVAEDHYEFKKSERNLIRKAQLEYDSFISEFKSALPKTEEQRLMDMNELKNAISILESFDAESYEIKERAHDAGTGIFYDKMSRKFMYLIDENKLSEFDFVPIQRIKYYAFSSIKNIMDEDFIPVLSVMKETNLISDIIEINPQFQIIVFEEEKKLELSNPEKVVLSFAYDEDRLTLYKLMELTEWKENYTKKIITELINRDIITMEGEIIKIKSFGEINERNKWNLLIGNIIQQEKKKEEKRYEKNKKRAAELKKKLAKVEKSTDSDQIIAESEKEIEIEHIIFTEKPSVKKLPTTSSVTEHKITETTDELSNTIEALDEIMPTEKKSQKITAGVEFETSDLQDLVPEKILQYHENFSLINGGFSQYEKIKQYIDKELEDVSEDLLKKMLGQLQQLQLIHNSIKIGNYDFYLFNDISLTDDDKKFIEYAVNKFPMKKEQFIQELNWEEQKVLLVMKSLQEKGIMRIEGDFIIISGIIQSE